jgi:peptidoglycan/LPS O-acetylase OafA/YrhL
MNERVDRFPLFDSLRALAALSILLLHGTGRAGILLDTPLHPFLANLYFGVAVFFVISGFLLYRPFVRAHVAGARSPDVRRYALRRLLRIVPAYWAALTAVGVVLASSVVFDPANAFLLYGFGQIYKSSTSFLGIGAAWSLCVEMTFYAMLPAFALAVRRLPGRTPEAALRNHAAALGVLAVVGMAWTAWAVGRSDINSTAAKPLLNVLPAYLDTFALGMGLAVVSVWLAEHADRPRLAAALERHGDTAWLVALGLWLVSIPVARDPEYVPMSGAAYVVKHVLFGLAAAAVVLPAVAGRPSVGRVRRLLAHRWLLWIGLISYGVYLYHQPVYALLSKVGYGADRLPGSAALLVDVGLALVLTIAVAAASYYVVERPAMNLRRRFETPREAATDQPGAVSVPAAATGTDSL